MWRYVISPRPKSAARTRRYVISCCFKPIACKGLWRSSLAGYVTTLEVC